MASHLRPSSFIENVADTVDATHAALSADPETTHLAPPWQAMTEKADALGTDLRKLGRIARRARARVVVTDALWDGTTGGFGRAVVDASNGRRDQPPYTRFYAKTSPSAAQGYGVQREVSLGEGWVTELKRNPQEPIAQAWMPRISNATEALRKAAADRDQAVTNLTPQYTAIALFIEDVNREVDRLEGDLKKLFPRDPKRVNSYLSAFRPSRATDTDDAEDPITPAPVPSPNG